MQWFRKVLREPVHLRGRGVTAMHARLPFSQVMTGPSMVVALSFQLCVACPSLMFLSALLPRSEAFGWRENKDLWVYAKPFALNSEVEVPAFCGDNWRRSEVVVREFDDGSTAINLEIRSAPVSHWRALDQGVVLALVVLWRFYKVAKHEIQHKTGTSQGISLLCGPQNQKGSMASNPCTSPIVRTRQARCGPLLLQSLSCYSPCVTFRHVRQGIRLVSHPHAVRVDDISGLHSRTSCVPPWASSSPRSPYVVPCAHDLQEPLTELRDTVSRAHRGQGADEETTTCLRGLRLSLRQWWGSQLVRHIPTWRSYLLGCRVGEASNPGPPSNSSGTLDSTQSGPADRKGGPPNPLPGGILLHTLANDHGRLKCRWLPGSGVWRWAFPGPPRLTADSRSSAYEALTRFYDHHQAVFH